jgi:DNA modification methylase
MAMSDFKFDQQNANMGTKRGKELLEQSIKELGAGRSILVDKDGNVIAGNKTLEAAQKAGLKVRIIPTDRDELVVVQRQDLDLTDSAGEARRLAYLDNRVGELDLQWDAEQLINDITQGLDLTNLGFYDHELVVIIGEQKDVEIDAEPQLDKAEELRNKWDTREGQVWQLGDHLLMCGDSTHDHVVQRLFGQERFDLLATDPPYGVKIKGGEGGEMTIANDNMDDMPRILAGAFRQAVKYADNKTAFYIAAPHGPQFHEFAKAIVEAGMVWKQTLVWSKNNLVLGRSDYQQKHEVFFYGNFGKGRRWNGGRKQTSVIEEQKQKILFLNDREIQISLGEEIFVVQGDNLEIYQTAPDVIHVEKPQKNELHPTMKPLKLMRRMIRNSSDQGDIVYDPFCGSGSTILASENEKRRCFALELLPKYTAVTLQRWQDATGKLPTLI